MSLFLKIFLWFWGAMAILALALSGIQVTTRDDLVIAPKSNLMIDALRTYGLHRRRDLRNRRPRRAQPLP